MWKKSENYSSEAFAFEYQYDKNTESPAITHMRVEDLSFPTVTIHFLDVSEGKRSQKLPIDGYANSTQNSDCFSLHLQSQPERFEANFQYLIAYVHGLQPFDLAHFPQLNILNIDIPYLSKLIKQDASQAYLLLLIISTLAQNSTDDDNTIKQKITQLLTTNLHTLKNIYRRLDISVLCSCLPNDPQKFLSIYLLMQSIGKELSVTFAENAEPNLFLQLGHAYEALGDNIKACEYYHAVPKTSACYKEALIKLKEYYGGLLCAHEANLIKLSDDQVQAYKYYYAKYSFLTCDPAEQSVTDQMSFERRGGTGLLPTYQNIKLNFHTFFNMESELKRLSSLNAELTRQNNLLTHELASYKHLSRGRSS